MLKRAAFRSVFVLALLFGLLTVVEPLAGSLALAERQKPPRHGEVVRRLPPNHRTVWMGRDRYYYHGGAFYRRGPAGFFVVGAPIGAFVVSVPIGSRAVLVGGMTYYVYDDVYYRRAGGGYIVTAPPRETIVVREVAPVVPAQPAQGEKVLVATPLLNLRSGPGLSFPVLCQLREGEHLTVHGYAPDWLYVKHPQGDFGWVMLRYTVQLPPPAAG